MKTVKRARNYDADADASSFDTIVESSSSVVDVASATGASSSGVSRVIGPGLDASSTAGRIDGASGRPAKKDKIKIFNDLVHTHIKVEGLCLEIVNTPQFQRMHGLKQLGVCDWVFRGATHTRFEHSLGVAHLAEKVLRGIQEKQSDLNITETDVTCVKVAALCHDLGHGPFSHVFDGVFIPAMAPDVDWRHEDGSVLMLKYLINSNNISYTKYGLEERDETFIYEIISGTRERDRKGRDSGKFYLYDIVNNSRSGLDVDKLDYFQRDMQMTNVVVVSKASFDRFIFNAKVLPAQPLDNSVGHVSSDVFQSPRKRGEEDNGRLVLGNIDTSNWPIMICYPEKQITEALELFRARFQMHSNVYTHKCVKQVEFMITDALKLADPHIRIKGTVTDNFPTGLYKMSECIHDMDAYSKLKDSILDIIAYDHNPMLEEAKLILDRIHKRKLYACLGKVLFKRGDDISEMTEDRIRHEVVMASHELDVGTNAFENSTNDNSHMMFYNMEDSNTSFNHFMPLSQDTISLSQTSVTSNNGTRGQFNTFGEFKKREPLREEDIIVEKMNIHYGLKSNNPVSRMRFFSKNASKANLFGREIQETQYGAFLPRSFESLAVRVFCRSSDHHTISTAHLAFREWCKHKRAPSPLPSYSQHDNDIMNNSAVDSSMGLGRASPDDHNTY